ncbi:hypothetical protein LTR05_002482 [Lithohypha guttulata]|uniref:RNase III domain-containing protein n=1 Tax=Lithohypha guttulata TaxID=1690604 RepID=A0AAN7T2R0_9EURO|nr:hypothetical protein LTR05_002482 [Lithohypha guttulata]
MKAPVRTRPQRQKPFTVNSDPTNLDAMYTRFLGRTGPKMLSDETKWLAVTHKSFDHGRRGFNDRLSFLGRQILELQTSLAVLTAADVTNQVNNNVDPFGRLAFHHPATANVGVLNGGAKEFYMHHKQMSGVASRYGLPEVVRWQPKDVDNLPASGSDMVYTQALFAIIGALSLEQGNQVANRIVRERILQPIGLRSDMVGTTPAQPQLNAS